MLHTLHTGKAWRHFVNRRYGETLAAARVSLAREKIYRFALAGSRDFSKNRENSDLNRAEGASPDGFFSSFRPAIAGLIHREKEESGR
jgi:hypothetical protein